MITHRDIRVLFQLISRDFLVFRPVWFRGLPNVVSWTLLTGFVFQYLLPRMGMPGNYGVFMACGAIISYMQFEIFGKIASMIVDMNGARTIEYDLTLPIPQWLIFVRFGISNTLQIMSLAILVIPLSKLILWNHFDLLSVSWIKFSVMFVLSSLFYGFYALLLASSIRNMKTMINVWMRVVFPLWYGGGFTFAWMTVKNVNPSFAYVLLLNPLVYAFEGLRGAVLGQAGFINFWYCVAGLMLAIVITGYFGTKKMMARLDCL